jgi:IS5 family transposase
VESLVEDFGDRPGELATLIEWEPFWEIVGDLYTNTTELGSQLNINIVFMIKLLVLQSMYGLSDPELERQANDKISFLRFLGFPGKISDRRTVWYFREFMSKTNKDRAIWKELQRQLEERGLKIRKRCDPGCDIHYGRSGTCNCRHSPGRRYKTRRNKEVTWTKR